MTFAEYCRLIAEIAHIPPDRLRAQASFRDELGIDSLQMVNLLVQLSERAGIGFDRLTGSPDLSTVGGLYESLRG